MESRQILKRTIIRKTANGETPEATVRSRGSIRTFIFLVLFLEDYYKPYCFENKYPQANLLTSCAGARALRLTAKRLFYKCDENKFNTTIQLRKF
jgi:hypothetical protein